MTKVLVLSCSLFLGSIAWADEHELHENMEKIGKAMGVLRKSVPAKSMTDVVSAAGTMAEAFPKTISVWEQKKMADAVQWTKEAEGYAKELKMAAEAGHEEHVSAVFGKLGGTCKSCHTAHREEIPDTNPKKYRIK
jgi:cytochrome c556